MKTEVGSYVKLWTDTDDVWEVALEEEPRIDAAVSTWIDSGGTRDALLMLTLTGGDPLKVRASHVASWMVSTPEGRRCECEREKASNEESKRIRQELGMWDDAA